MGHIVIAGLGFGDEGKGTLTDAICARRNDIQAVVRYNGGCQSGHNVVTNDNVHHEFSQFGAGTLQGVRTILSRYMLVDPLAVGNEASHLLEIGVEQPLSMLTISENALVVTPYHAKANQWREARRSEHSKHGSVGRGIGETRWVEREVPELALRMGDLRSESVTRKKLEGLYDLYIGEFDDATEFGSDIPYDQLVSILTWFPLLVKIESDDAIGVEIALGDCVFEGAQGVLLDELYGFEPYNTWTNCTFANALGLVAESGSDRDVERVGVTRAYATRHGKGPLPTEDHTLYNWLCDVNNPYNAWQRSFRVGHLDLPMLRTASLIAGGMDSVAITHLDRVADQEVNLLVCDRYLDDRIVFDHNDSRRTMQAFMAHPDLKGPEIAIDLLIQANLGVPCSVKSFGPRTGDKEFLIDL